MSSLAEVLAGLQKSYLAAIPEKIVNLEALFKASELVKLETEYHKLKGTGRTYGLPEVTEIGAVLERICQLDPGNLATAVPLSLTLLAKMRDHRTAGQPYVLDGELEFIALNKIVEAAQSKAS
jgi:Hpt domain